MPIYQDRESFRQGVQALRIRSSIIEDHIVNEILKRNNDITVNTERLSSGKRIQRAADDAAGLAISDKLTTQINGAYQAIRNSLDGISLLNTAEGGITEILEMLQRARTLSIQAANDTLTSSDRALIQKEINQIIAEIDRQTSTIEFNTKKLLNGESDQPPTSISSQADFQRGSSSQGMGVDQIDMTSVPGTIRLATEPFQVDAAHTNIGAEDYISIERINVTPNGNQYDVTLEVKFSATGGANNYIGDITINNANVTGVGPLVGNEGGSIAQAGNTVNFNITENGDADESVFTIDFTTTSLDSSFTLNLTK